MTKAAKLRGEVHINITLTYAQAQALRHGIQACLSLADRSPVVAAAIDVLPKDIAQIRRALKQIPANPKPEHLKPATDNQ